MEEGKEIKPRNNPPKIESWETELYIKDGERLTISEKPNLVFIILRASGQKGVELGQGKFIYEIHDIREGYMGYYNAGGSGLPRSREEAITRIRITYQQQVLEKRRNNPSPTI